MALEPAGVSLQAQGFKDYIGKLDAIDRQQRKVFDAEFKGTDKSYTEVTKAAKQYRKELDKLADSERKAANEAKKLAAQEQAAAATRRQAAISTANVIVDITKQVSAFVNESARLAAQFQGQQTGLNNLAASFGQSGSAIQSAIQRAAKGTISGLDAINAANQGLLLGVARTPEEFEKITGVALTLGRTLGLTGTQAIEQFTTALGRQSLLILDNFGISAKQVNAEIERLAQADFSKARSELTEAQKQATFMKAALNIAAEAAGDIGEEAGKAQASFDALDATSKDLQVTFGAFVKPLAVGSAEALTRAGKTAQQVLAIVGAGVAGVRSIAVNAFDNIATRAKNVGRFIFGGVAEPVKTVSELLDEAGEAATNAFKDIASTIEGVSFDEDEIVKPIENQADAIKEATVNLEAYQSALRQAENLQLSFARAAEDAALKLARANEDIARKQAKAVADLEGKQKKEREKLLDDQIKQLENFEKDREKQIAKAEKDIQKARGEAAEKRKRDQEKLHRDLQRAQERFNLSQLQSERRFKLSESRLRAEGDILALKELREDRALERQEEKENFDLSKKEQVDSAKEQQREQQRDLEDKVKELKEGLEEQRAELLASFDEQLRAQQEAQAEATALQQQKFADDAVEREIALAREEEDRRISQRRQLEDLGRSFAEQEGVTVEGTEAIAAQLEKIFGIEGTASNIMSGFTAKTESDFTKLFGKLEEIIKGAELEPETSLPIVNTGPLGFGGRIGGPQEFQHGGVVEGPLGSPQIVRAHAGETILPTHQARFNRQMLSSTDSFRMVAPVIPSQNLNVNMSGGFNITGSGQANDEILQAAAQEMTETFRIAIRRIERRN